jgi:hypothetical protein
LGCLKYDRDFDEKKGGKHTVWGNCIDNFYWNGQTCSGLGNIGNVGNLGNIPPQACISGYSWNGYTCVFSGNTAAYTCLDGYYWNGITCTFVGTQGYPNYGGYTGYPGTIIPGGVA